MKINTTNYQWNAIVAVDNKLGIGRTDTNGMLWHISEDMAHFKNKTTGKIVVMGRKTFESLGNKPLPKRINIVVSKNKTSIYNENSQQIKVIGALTPQGLYKLIQHDYPDRPMQDVWIIGGGQIYKLMILHCNKIYATRIDADFNCDIKFPFIKFHGCWDRSGRDWYQTYQTDKMLSEKQGLSYMFYEFTKDNKLDN